MKSQILYRFRFLCLVLLLLQVAACNRKPWPPKDPVNICKHFDTIDFSGFLNIHVVKRSHDWDGDPIFFVYPPDTTIDGFYVVRLHNQDGSVKSTSKVNLSDSTGIDFGHLERSAVFIKYLQIKGLFLESNGDLMVVPYPVERYRLFRRAAPSHPLPHPSHLWENIYKNWYLEDRTNR